MKKRNHFVSTAAITLGLLLLAAALGLTGYNYYEGLKAEESAANVLSELTVEMPAELQPAETKMQLFLDPKHEKVPEMPTIVIQGHDYIGTLSIPDLELELPILAEWDLEMLRVSPARYYGSYYTDDLVIAAHNYPTHFSKLRSIRPDTDVYFTTADGYVYHYLVDYSENLQPSETEKMITGDWDLTLFTCSINGQGRCTVRCSLAQ